ncbi:response regulator transcription factor [Rhizobium leguminosarum]
MMSDDLIHTSRHQAAVQRIAVLIADPEVNFASPLVQRLMEDGFDVCLADNANVAREHLLESAPAFAIVELAFDDGNGVDLVQAIARSYPCCRTLIHSRFCTLSNAVQAIKAGARDVLPKPTDVEFLIGVLLNRDLLQSMVLSSLPAPGTIRRAYIRETYTSCGANVTQAARRLSMHRRTLQRMLKRFQLL